MGGLVDLRFVGWKWEREPTTSPDLVRDTSEKVDLIRKYLLIA